jgi:cellulose synthase operon protein C
VRKARFTYVLLAPEERRIYANELSLPGLERSERTLPGGVRERRWTVTDLPRLEMEPGMPGPGESVPYVHVSTYATWGEVARFYEGLVREQLRPGPEVRATAARIAAEVRARPGSAGRSEKELRADTIRAVHDWVVTNTRYVGLEFGIHGYKPYPVEQVIARRFGDCKDKASLTHALLESLGIDSRLVLLRMRRLGNVAEKPASLAVFNHAILYVPELDLWLDGTATGSGSRELPSEDRGANALVVNPGAEPTFGTVPEARPSDNRMVSDFRAVLARDGSATLDGVTTTTGVRAPEQRAAYQVEASRRTALERSLSRTFPGLRVESVDVGDLTRLEDDVRIAFRLALPRLARQENGGLSLPPFGQGQAWMENLAPLSTRRQDLVVGSPFVAQFTFRHKLPPGLAAVDLPAPEAREGPFGAWSVAVRAEGDELVAEGTVRLTASRVRPDDYPAFREFLARLDRALSRAVRLAPPGRGP